jgi:transcriptional regulator with XRE-family HTH domain
MVDFGKFIREKRTEAEISQLGLARAIGVNHTYLSKIESGKMPPPSAETVLKLADALDGSSYEFLCAANICVYCKGTGKIKKAGQND